MNAQTLLLLTTGFASEETTNNIKNISTILAIVIAVFTILKEIKGVSNIFGTKCNLPESLYFTQSYDSRVRKKKARIRTSRGSLFILYLIFLAMFFTVGHFVGHKEVSQASIIISGLTSLVMFPLYIRTNLLASKKKKCHVGDNAKLRKTGGIAFLLAFFTFTSLSYTISIGLKETAETKIFVLALIIALVTVVLFLPIYAFHMDCMVSLDREEAIALGYVMHDKKPEFIHYLEDDYFVCSNSAYFNDYDPIDFYEKSWIKNKKVYLLDSRLKNQIIDLDNYQRELKDIKSIPSENKEIIAKGQYKKLNEQEVKTLNDWIDDLFKKKNNTPVEADSKTNNGAA